MDIATRKNQIHVVAFLTACVIPKSAASCSTTRVCSTCKPCSSDKKDCANCGVDFRERNRLMLKACSRCKTVYYCSESCQRQHWTGGDHKKFCVAASHRKAFLGSRDENVDTRIENPNSASRGNISSEECSVCLDPLNNSATRVLPCGHVFHVCCLVGIESIGLSKKCPLCRSCFVDEVK